MYSIFSVTWEELPFQKEWTHLITVPVLILLQLVGWTKSLEYGIHISSPDQPVIWLYFIDLRGGRGYRESKKSIRKPFSRGKKIGRHSLEKRTQTDHIQEKVSVKGEHFDHFLIGLYGGFFFFWGGGGFDHWGKILLQKGSLENYLTLKISLPQDSFKKRAWPTV